MKDLDKAEVQLEKSAATLKKAARQLKADEERANSSKAGQSAAPVTSFDLLSREKQAD